MPPDVEGASWAARGENETGSPSVGDAVGGVGRVSARARRWRYPLRTIALVSLLAVAAWTATGLARRSDERLHQRWWRTRGR